VTLFFSPHWPYILFIERRVPVVVHSCPFFFFGDQVFAGLVYPRFLVGLVSCYSIFSFMCMFCGSLFVFCTFSFGHCGVCSSSIYGFWLPLWYLQTLLTYKVNDRLVITGTYRTSLKDPRYELEIPLYKNSNLVFKDENSNTD
jgi:hypothetical protein